MIAAASTAGEPCTLFLEVASVRIFVRSARRTIEISAWARERAR